MIAIFPEIAACAARGDLERLAILCRTYFGLSETYAPRPDIGGLLLEAGLRVERLALECHAALLAKDESGSFQIVALINENMDPQSERFTLAHLLGHFLFDIQPLIARGDCLVSGYRELVCPLRRYSMGTEDDTLTSLQRKKEQLADDFAAALLMPKGMVLRAIAKLGSHERTAEFFAVSRPCLMQRLVAVGHTKATPANFLDAERKIGVIKKPAREDTQRDLKAPIAEPAMPRSYAASSYGATERSTRRVLAKEAATADDGAMLAETKPVDRVRKKPADPASIQTESLRQDSVAASQAGAESKIRQETASASGMDRIRQIARLLDKS